MGDRMTATKKTDPIVLSTAPQIEGARLASIEGRLKLELKGIRFGGTSTFAFVKRTFEMKGSRASVLKQFQAYRERFNTAHGFATVTSETAAVPRPTASALVNIPVETAGRAAHQIAHLMSGHAWSADTLDAIARILVEAGFTMRDPDGE
jgi:hypothetical protein